MEGWFPCRYGEQPWLRIVKAAECRAQFTERSRRMLPADPAAELPRITKTRRNASERNALPSEGVDARCQSTPSEGEVRFDTSLHGRKNKLRFYNLRPVSSSSVNPISLRETPESPETRP